MSMRRSVLRMSLLALVLGAAPVAAQDGNIMEPVDTIERRLLHDSFQLVDFRGSRMEGDRTSRAALSFPDGKMMVVKWGAAPPGAEAFNNQPRYEAAAYRIQKLFLDEADYVVPPTVIRAFPSAVYEQLDPGVPDTFRGVPAVLVTLQYWLFNVTGDDVWDEERLATDTAYARHFANLNVLTYLIRHNDSNQGNILISRDPANPRVFAVDNGLAFSNIVSDRGTRWRHLRVDRLPRSTVERLRAITEAELRRALGTVVEFRVEAGGVLTPVAPGENLDDGRGVRHDRDVIQLGLTEREIRQVWSRLEDLLEDIDEGKYLLF
jgi:hypothetical protein